MKLLKSVLATAALAAFATSAAHAATTIRITGSTAYRTAVTNAIENIMGGAGNFEAVYRDSDSGVTSEINAKASIFKGNITGANNPVTIKCFWSGSVGGVKTVAQSLTLANSWIADAELTGTNGVSHKASPTYDAAVTADITMSDTRQSTTKFTSPALTATRVGVVPFVWIKSNGAPSGLSNMTGLLARAVLSNPGVPLAQFTGNSADTTMVLAVGRDQDSGTRVGAFAESGFGTLTAPIQWKINGTGSVSNVELYPAQTILGDSYAIGTSGYSGGGNVVAALNLTGSATAPVYDTSAGAIGDPAALLYDGAYYVGYVGTSDAKSLTGHSQNVTTGIFTSTGALQVLTYNGVQYSYANVKEGLYTFWTYEYIMWRSGLGSDGVTVGNALKNEILNNTASLSGIRVGDMHASRTIEGGVVGHN